MTVRIRNTRGDNVPQPPAHPNGRPYRFEMLAEGETVRVYADEPGELVAELIDGYARLLSPVDKEEARIRYAVGAQVAVQAAVINERGLEGCTEQEQAILLGSREQQPSIDEWRAPVPLVLVASFYQPARPLARPQAQEPAQIWWIDPRDEVSLLHDLHQLGLVTLNVATATGPGDS